MRTRCRVQDTSSALFRKELCFVDTIKALVCYAGAFKGVRFEISGRIYERHLNNSISHSYLQSSSHVTYVQYIWLAMLLRETKELPSIFNKLSIGGESQENI